METLNVSEALSGRRILFAGCTGFVGKVALSMLLDRYGDNVEKLYVLARRGSSLSAERRFFDKIIWSEPFLPLRERYGEADVADYIRQKCTILEGDITLPLLGLTQTAVDALTGGIDILINCAGLVSFNPSLEVGLKINTIGVKNAVEVCRRLKVPLVHVSTAFVAGNRSGLVFEDEDIHGYFPKRSELDRGDFSLEEELGDCDKIIARLREQADDKALSSSFRRRAVERLSAEGRDANDEKTLRLAIGRERKLWLSTELIKAGMDRANHWGWPNTYTYTKSLGEQVIAQAPDLACAIARPSIVESAIRYPFPGWNEGFTTSAPLCFAGIKGHRMIPAGSKTILDIVPVDLVAGSLIAITANTLLHRGRRIFQLASGDTNPFFASRSVELVGLYRRRHFRKRKIGNDFYNEMLSRIEPVPVSERTFKTFSAPFFAQGAHLLRGFIDERKPAWGAPTVAALLQRASEKLEAFENQATSLSNLVDLFLPFMWENRYVFRCDNTRALYQSIEFSDKAKIPWDPESIDWREYFLNTHLPGLEKWVFPGLEEETERKTAIHAYRDLLELLEASVHAFRHRVAFRMVEGDKEERFTYGQVHRYAGRVGSFLIRSGIQPGDRVLLISENRPEWAMTYFGILRAGATVVPVDTQFTEAEVVNIARRSEAAACLLSEQAAQQLPGLFRAFSEANLRAQIHSLAQAMEGDSAFGDRIGPIKRGAAPDDVASLIFTSGTTGQPKGVMLTHRNFSALVAKLVGAFNIGVGDGLVSVLPLHHTFEFSCGFLTPFSRGAEVTYIDELTADRLGEVLETGRITAMIGVPALWQLLHRKITQEITAKPTLVEQTIKGLMAAHAELRNRSDINLGKLLFWPIHRKFGGRIRFLVSGGSALSEEIQEAFHALGFNIAEGYGLTEAAPVLSVAELGNRHHPGSVGKALPGIELKIVDPDPNGIGEVIARGPNVMAGYFGDRAATDATVKDGWLYTGDLGRLDEEGRLYLAGRKKDVIIDSNGRNVYPDELEEVYGKHSNIKELSIVGLPDELGGEKVACLCVPDYKDRPKDEVRRDIENHFREKSGDLPFYRRVKVLRIRDGELPRTSTRKVRRKLVVDELKRLERAAASGERIRYRVPSDDVSQWLYPLIAEVIQRPQSQIHPESRLTADLGVDSLMATELAVALEQVGASLPSLSDLSQVATVGDLQKMIVSAHAHPRDGAPAPVTAEGQSKEIQVPASVADLGRKLLSFGQKFLYGGIFDVDVSGKSFIPQSENFLVASNHASHLDMGLIKVVLGDQGERLTALAARDYFFDTPLKRAYFENFTNLIPMDRKGSLRESLRLAGEALRQGYNLLIFPEGTRTTTGEISEFKPTLGYLALTCGVGILPVYLEGTFEALPKGAIVPKNTKLKVRIGPLLGFDDLKRLTTGMARSESYRTITSYAERSVTALREGRILSLEAEVSHPRTPAPHQPSARHHGTP